MIQEHAVNHGFFFTGNGSRLHEPVHVKTISLDGRDTSCRSMGLFQISFILQVLHFIADGGAADAQVVLLRNGPGAYRFSGIRIILYNGPQYFSFSFIQFIGPNVGFVLVCSACCHHYHLVISTHWSRVLTYVIRISFMPLPVKTFSPSFPFSMQKKHLPKEVLFSELVDY